MKRVGLGFMVLVALLVAGGLFWLRGNLDGSVKNAIANYGSEMTQAKVSVSSVEINVGDGTGIIRGLSVGNPTGFKTAYALKVGDMEISIDIASVPKDVILIRKIAIRAPDVIYENGEVMTNFDAIQKNIATYLGPSAKKGDGGGKKLIVEELTVRNAKAKASAPLMQGKTISISLPDITLRNLGKAKGGMPAGELGEAIVQALKKNLSSAINFDNLAKPAGQAFGKASSTVKGMFGK